MEGKITDLDQRVSRLEAQEHAQAKTLSILSYVALGNAITILLLGINLLRIVFQ